MLVRQDGLGYFKTLVRPGGLTFTLPKAVVTVVEGASAILSKWFLLSRLETRTKESNTYASVLVEKPTRGMKVSDAKRKQQHQPTMIISERFE